jgi:uncharacterized protein
MSRTALITGASGGIGMELALEMASHGHSVVLVARSVDKLARLAEEIKTRYSVEVHLIGKDLSIPGSAAELYAEVQRLGLKIDILVNNAGFGLFGFFSETDWKKEEEMINLNMLALTHLTKLFLPDMIKAKYGKVLNVASTAAFQPGPTMAVYYATKSYVLFFSEAIANELEGTGVTVTALCPGPTTSGFQDAAALGESKLVKGKKLPSAAEVAKYGYAAMMKGKQVAIHGAGNAMLANIVRFIPRSLVVKMVRSAQEKA